MENGKQGAFATASDGCHQAGLTKREYFAGLAMQGICVEKHVERDEEREKIARWSVKIADALIEELEKTK
jgi:hypothetical protein